VLTVAVTGGIGSGKSLVGEYLQELGAIVCDSDQFSRIVIERGSAGFDEVVARFGDSILRDGQIDRERLGELVFSDESARRDLEGIIHPRVRAMTDQVLRSAKEGDVVVNQIPLLFETAGADRFDFVITVEAEEQLRISRLVARGMKEYDARKRIAAQASDIERRSIADVVIDNNGDQSQLLTQVEKIWRDELLPRARGSADAR
jgi:dephospho-CoA kinase